MLWVWNTTPLYKRLWRPVEEDELGEQVLFQAELSTLTHQVDVQAELEDTVNIGHVVKHDGEWAARHEAPNDAGHH